MDDPDRGIGRTTKQMREAPQGALYIVHDGATHAFKRQADDHGLDLMVRAQGWLDNHYNWIGSEFTGVVVDHACKLTARQSRALEDMRPYVRSVALDGERFTVDVGKDRIDITGPVPEPLDFHDFAVVQMKATETIQLAKSEVFHSVQLSDAGKEVFRFSHDGVLTVDWAALRAMKDRFDEGCRDWPVIWAAALWTARNSM